MILIGFLIITLKKKPFQTVSLNNLETISLVTSTVTVFCGLFFILDIKTVSASSDDQTSSVKNTSGVYLTENTKLTFFFIIVFANVTFLIYWTYKFLQEMN